MIMEYQKIANWLDGASNQPSKFRTKNWVEINDESRGTYTGSDIKFKTTMLRSNLCDNADAYILVKWTITATGAGDNDAAKRLDERNKVVTFNNCAPFTKCISRINNTDIDSAQDIGIVMPMYNLIEHNDKYSKTSGSLWQYYKDDRHDNIAQFASFKCKIKITGKTLPAGNTKDFCISSKDFWRTFEMPVIICEVSLIFTWSSTCVISSATGETKFEIT